MGRAGDCLIQWPGKGEVSWGQAGMRWGTGGRDLGSLAGHGFGGGLFPLAPLRGPQARCSGRCGKPLGLFWPLCPGGLSSPQSLRALPEMGGQRGDRAGCGGEGGKGGGQESSKRPLGPSAGPTPPPPPAGGRMMEAAVVRWRAGVQCGHEGHAQSPRVCVRAWGWARPPPLPARAGPGGARGPGGHQVRPASRAGPQARRLP